jgi:hypothetical protein
MNTYDTQEKMYFGISNPSGAIALDNNLFIVADDEDNKLRIYDRNILEKPVQTIALSSVFKGVIADGEDQEIDIESGAEIEGTYFWIGSHSTSRQGKHRPSRHRLFAVSLKPGANGKYKLSPVGVIYTTLIDDIQKDSRFDAWNLGKSKNTQAKAIGGLSIEGLAATKENGFLIGFRNPLRGGKIKNDRLEGGKALIVELLNPFEVIHGIKAKFADPIELDLGGLGIREITQRKKNKYLIVAGPYHDNNATKDHEREKMRLYQWSRKSGKITCLKNIDLGTLTIEAALFYPGNDVDVQLLSDDGKMAKVNGFRSISLTI